MRRFPSLLMVFVVAVVAVVAVSAAAAQPAPPSNPLSQAIRNAWDGAKHNVTASADLMPEAGYAFKPVETVRSFGQILAHIAGANYEFCAPAKGEKPPHAEDEFEKNATTKADIVKALNESLAYCDAAYTALDDKTAGEMIDKGPDARVAPLLGNIGHLNQHYGNLVTYFRIKGMVPPSSAPRP
jgi:uncharacterized damage-inducible protein DinB